MRNKAIMPKASLIWSSMDHERSNILVLDNTNAATQFFHRAFSQIEKNRLVITKGKYFYAPSNEYKQFVTRIKNIK
jgi:hypothetical protein